MKQRSITLNECVTKRGGNLLVRSFIAKAFFLVYVSLFSITYISHAQSQTFQEKKERIEAQKIAFITKMLALTPREAQVFWPVYNQYQKEKAVLKRKHKTEMEKRKKLNEMTDAEIETLVDSEIVYKQNELNLQKKYHSQFKAVLPIKKVAKLYHAESQFKRELLKRIKK